MKITLDRTKCIGCGSCAAICPKYFELGNDGLASPKEGKISENLAFVEITEPGCAKEAAEVCPVQAITIE